MSFVSLSKIPDVIREFAASRVLPSAPTGAKWMIAGAMPLICSNWQAFASSYLKAGEMLRLICGDRVDIDKAREFLSAAFQAEEKLPAFGFVFNRMDGEALIEILERFRD